MEHLKGTVERITYYNAENGYTVMRLRPDDRRFATTRDGLITIVGAMPEVQPGESVALRGEWRTDPKWGKQFKAEHVQQTMPATAEGIRRYLGSGMIKGIGPRTAEKIVAHFGVETLNMLDYSPDSLREVEDIGPKRTIMIKKAWKEQQAVKEVMLFLQGHKVSTSLAIKIYKQYGDESVELVRENPYRLARDIWGIGFLTADRIAQDIGIPQDSPYRMEAGVIYALNEATNDGHVYVPRHELVQKAADLLREGTTPDTLEAAIDRMHSTGEIAIDAIPSKDMSVTIDAIYLPPMFYAETGAAKRLHRMADAADSRLNDLRTMQWESFLAGLKADAQVALTEQQRDAVQQALTNKVSVLTGGPGTGKTTTLRTVINALDATAHQYQLCSPTGRAAKRLSEATGQPAQTIHRLLGYSPAEGFTYNEENPLDTDMVVVDESSMIDLALFYNLLKAIAPNTHLLLVGDVDQLPSVGAGDVLRDMIRAEVLSVTRLDAIFRQEGSSMIVRNAHRINHGNAPDTSNESDDFFFFGAEEAPEAAELIIDIVQNRIPSRFGHDPLDDIQVLVPMYRGQIGVEALNQSLQATLNPPGRVAERRLMGRLFRVGDKVMQTRNNYDKEIYNGDIGRVHSFDLEDQIMKVRVDGRIVVYDWSECDELTLAYAISVHKSQGSEYPVVVMPVHTQHFMMLQRNLLYTGITRAKQMVVLVGTRKAISIAVRNDKITQRYSALAHRVQALE